MTNEELVANHSKEILGKFFNDLICEDQVDVRFDYEDDEQWAVVTMYYDEEDKEVSLRLYVNDIVNMFYGYYDSDDEFIEIIKPLSEEEKKMFPKSLQKIMSKVLIDETGMRIPGNLLSK